MNKKGKEHIPPKTTNPVGGSGHGGGTGLGGVTFIDELIAKDDSSIEALFQRSSSGKGTYILPRIESLVSTMGRPTEASNPVVTPNRGALEEK